MLAFRICPIHERTAETLDVAAKLEKVRDWLARNEGSPDANPYIVRIARDYLRDKPREAALRAALQ